MKKQKFIENVKKDIFNLDELGNMTQEVIDDFKLKSLGDLYLTRIKEAEEKFIEDLKKLGIEFP